MLSYAAYALFAPEVVCIGQERRRPCVSGPYPGGDTRGTPPTVAMHGISLLFGAIFFDGL